ncbi:MAG: hypothetical protein KC912_22095 [Proteobacteria bacterium]|nr:hypothetical protein [Pseudomonadota bacterium]
MSLRALALTAGLVLAVPAWAGGVSDTADTADVTDTADTTSVSSNEATNASGLAGETGGVLCGCSSSPLAASWVLLPALALLRRRS